MRNPTLDKSTAITEEERQTLGLVGLVPDTAESMKTRLDRVNVAIGPRALAAIPWMAPRKSLLKAWERTPYAS